MQPVTTEYKGHSLIVLNAGEKYPFQFGITKAKLIVENIDAIRAVVASNGATARVSQSEGK